MRWKKRDKEKRIKLGSTRVVTKFLWRKKLIDGEYRWLEFGKWLEKGVPNWGQFNQQVAWRNGDTLREDRVKWIPLMWYVSPTTDVY